ncbi:ORF86 [Ranid herpesvirus 1]|uniref:DNA (cytosine-5-)-methyltransferase n=1 Tax=Ranid herpesvirus 1 TaxID=85655 RepID=Q9YQY1_9VIRU|nr:ORF86 [Ranid herpesvirus 1]AAD12284.1 ORF86 [Ranid herpesvirus 1]
MRPRYTSLMSAPHTTAAGSTVCSALWDAALSISQQPPQNTSPVLMQDDKGTLFLQTGAGHYIPLVTGAHTALGRHAKPGVVYARTDSSCTAQLSGTHVVGEVLFGGWFNPELVQFTSAGPLCTCVPKAPIAPVHKAGRVRMEHYPSAPGLYPPRSAERRHGSAKVKGSNNDTHGPGVLWYPLSFDPRTTMWRAVRLQRAEDREPAERVPYTDVNELFWGNEGYVLEEHLDPRSFALYTKRVPHLDEDGDPVFYVRGKVPGFVTCATKQSHVPIRPLHTMDVFSGCGGLSLGLCDAGLCDVRWAIDNWPVALDALKANHANATTIEADVGVALHALQESGTMSHPWPAVGEVECMVGGPPCQGYSILNRFPHAHSTKAKNTLVNLYIALALYYKPAVLIMENVRNLTAYKKGRVLCGVVEMLRGGGYDVMLNILQAGHYGVPQTRQRVIVVATLPNALPEGPPPALHAFSHKACNLTLPMSPHGAGRSMRYLCGPNPSAAAPFRTITLAEAFSGLAEVTTSPCPSGPMSWYARAIAKSEGAPCFHESRSFEWINNERIASVPAVPGADWRDIPNEERTSPDGTVTLSKLRYIDEKLGIVCPCQLDKTAPHVKHGKTLVPWWLPHKASSKNGYAGLYGRNDMSGFLSTVLTNPMPGNKQGRVLHPRQPRVLSARESARGQGFPDSYVLKGALLDVYKQVGNAVPPPMARAIGLRIASALRKCKVYSRLLRKPRNETPLCPL